jgi:hypothetical protein
MFKGSGIGHFLRIHPHFAHVCDLWIRELAIRLVQAYRDGDVVVVLVVCVSSFMCVCMFMCLRVCAHTLVF